jgi:hypothetical protein
MNQKLWLDDKIGQGQVVWDAVLVFITMFCNERQIFFVPLSTLNKSLMVELFLTANPQSIRIKTTIDKNLCQMYLDIGKERQNKSWSRNSNPFKWA